MNDRSGRRAAWAAGLIAGIVAVCGPSGCHGDRRADGLDGAADVVRDGDAVRVERPGLPNAYELVEGVYSGGAPAGAEGFSSLRAMGIRTLISVDGEKPDVELAHRYGFHYIHIPIQYNGIEEEERIALAKALRDSPEPIYVHCHHGLHRGPAGAVYALVALGRISSEQGVRDLHEVGTSEAYPGLYQCVADAQPMPEALIDGYDKAFVETAPVPKYVEAMDLAASAFEHITLLRDNEWRAPARHPDLVAVAEAGMLHDDFRAALADAGADRPADFYEMMDEILASTDKLERALASGDAARASELVGIIGQACNDCHVKYRNPAKR